MEFYSGFSLKNEEYLFNDFIQKGNYTICGFSYGAIKAVYATLQRLKSGSRVDVLQLFSPAFFQTRDEKFKRLQYINYNKNINLYMKQFIDGCFSPYEKKIIESKETRLDELKDLLEYKWSLDELKSIENANVKIEVYLGGMDKIINTNQAKDFFLQIATVTYIKDANHFLQIN